ncbi:RDD family protein [Oceanobacillus senegalensis]|uniref:RDD family protein n=1 Tax=Oceanobacillus senegalensis TaxID=1936063 RepID=UPI000A30E4FB|nr:RDD family protein [Oceanobacillus senegalensis]
MKKVWERLFAYLIDSCITIIGGFVFAGAAGAIGFFASPLISVFVPYVPSELSEQYEWMERVMVLSSLVGMFVFTYLCLVVVFKLNQTIGYEKLGLQMKGNNKTTLLLKLLIRYGTLFIVYSFPSFSASSFGFESVWLDFLLIAYIFYHLIDGVLLLSSKGNQTLTDKWLGMEIVETQKRKT